MKSTLKGYRYSCTDNFKTKKKVLLSCFPTFKKSLKTFYLQVEGGPTGYESFPITKRSIKQLQKEPDKMWAANFGTKGSWDKLDIPAKELLRVFKEFGFIK